MSAEGPSEPAGCGALSVAVVRGGPAREHDVSVASGAAVSEALRGAGVTVADLLVDRRGCWTCGTEAADHAGRPGPRGAALRALEGADVAFLALHGPWGEDGSVQGLLETLGVPYTGSGVLASALAMDKGRTKEVLAHHGVRTPPWVDVAAPAWRSERAGITARLRDLPGPWVVKPARDGSSFGVRLVDRGDDLPAALDEALAEPGARVLVERRVAGTEVTCPVLGNAGSALETLPLIEIVPRGRDFFDFEAKYQGASEEICPARVDERVAATVRALALIAHSVLA